MDKIIMNCLTVKGLDSLVAGKKIKKDYAERHAIMSRRY